MQIGRLPNGIDLSNSVENEYFCLKLIAALGVPAANVEIADFGGRRTLVIERFDRRWTADNRLLRSGCAAPSSAPSAGRRSRCGERQGQVRGQPRLSRAVAVRASGRRRIIVL